MAQEPYRYFPGTVPVVMSIPHTGIYVPPTILERFTPAAKQLPDTDWHVERLYAFARALGVHLLAATHSRYVVDLNRAPDDASLYPGRFTTGLCPATLFDGTLLYEHGKTPDAGEIQQRTAQYWQPYHTKLAEVIATLRAQHNKVVVFDAHSIRSQVPTFFEGTLPDLNFGTSDGATASAELASELVTCAERSAYSVVLNGRFKGGYITRYYGNPARGIHAVQLELAQKNYMQENFPFAYEESKAKQLQKILRAILTKVMEWCT